MIGRAAINVESHQCPTGSYICVHCMTASSRAESEAPAVTTVQVQSFCTRVIHARSGFPTPESAFPTLRNIHVRAVQSRDRRATEQLERAIQIGAQDLDGAVHPSFTRSSQTVCVRAPAQHRIGA